MGRARPEMEFIKLDERNALIFSEANTERILGCIREATAHPEKRAGLYGEMARRFHIDPEKMNLAVIMYVDRLKRQKALASRAAARASAGPASGGAGTDRDGKRAPLMPEVARERAELDEKLQMAELCRQVGHRFVTITLSLRRGHRECERCGKVGRLYKI